MDMFDIESFQVTSVHPAGEPIRISKYLTVANRGYVSVRATSKGREYTAGGVTLEEAIEALKKTIYVGESPYYQELQRDYDSRMGSYRGD